MSQIRLLSVEDNASLRAAMKSGLEATGKSRVYLGGLAESLHKRNMEALVRKARKK